MAEKPGEKPDLRAGEQSTEPEFIAADQRPTEAPVNWDALAEARIQAAQHEGKFKALPGLGKPIPGIDAPHDENWWAREKLRREQLDLLPPSLAAAREVERFWISLHTIASENAVREAVDAVNARIKAAHYSVAPGPPNRTMPLEIDAVLERYRSLRSAR